MNKITLIIVDFQKDFSNSLGKLYVQGSELAKQVIVDYIKKYANQIGEIIFTVDWHTVKHCSFKINGGIWPAHCVQYSEGAGIDDDILHTCIDLGISYKIFIKGNNDTVEEYGAFEKIGVAEGVKGYYICANNHTNTSYVTINNLNLVVCGIAGDYCVLNTIKNLEKFKSPLGEMFSIKVLQNAIPSIDDGTTLNNYIRERNIGVVNNL